MPCEAPVEPVPEARPCLEDFGLSDDIDFEALEAEYADQMSKKAEDFSTFHEVPVGS